MDALAQQIQSHIDYVLDYCFWVHAKQILTIITKIKNNFKSPVCFAIISMRGMKLDTLPLSRSSSFLHFKYSGVLSFQILHLSGL